MICLVLNQKSSKGEVYPHGGSHPKRKEKKYMIKDPKTDKWVYFGQMGYEDYTKHKNKTRRKNYLTRSSGMRGHWKNNKFSANNLAMHVLW